MPSISKEKVWINGVEWIKHITYSNSKFRLKLPDEISDDLGFEGQDRELKADSEFLINQLWNQTEKQWKESIKKNEKVIFFESKFTGALAVEGGESDKHNKGIYNPDWIRSNIHPGYYQSLDNYVFAKNEISFAGSSLGMLIKWGVYEKTQIGKSTSYKILKGRDMEIFSPLSIKNSYTQINWTQEREDFFLELDKSFAKMIAKVFGALGNLTPEKMELLADSGTKLLN